jgi:hypothetical protein
LGGIDDCLIRDIELTHITPRLTEAGWPHLTINVLQRGTTDKARMGPSAVYASKGVTSGWGTVASFPTRST